MSLDWSAAKVKDWKEKDQKDGGGWCKVVTFECMAVDLNGPTEKNIDEFCNRSAMWRKVHGHDLIPEEHIRDFIGLITNVSNETRPKWLKRVWLNWESHQRGRRRYEREDRERAEAEGKKVSNG